MKRFAKWIGLLLGILLALVLFSDRTAAGGWAVVTLDALPANVTAGQPFTIGFMVRQHGEHPAEGLRPTVSAVHTETGDIVQVQAEAEGEAGHYAATIMLPNSGTWEWKINAISFVQPMPEIAVQAATLPTASGTSRSFMPLALLGWLAAAGFFLFGWRAKSRLVVGLGMVTAVIGLAVFVLPTAPLMDTAVAQNAASSIEEGEALFVAKGCIMCHVNERVIKFYAPHIGPDLTNYVGSPEYLRTWLADPPALKPNTWMPNLQLSDGEIEALVAFLTVETIGSATD